MKYTVFSDYYATGEGRTMMVLFVLAPDEKTAARVFAEAFGDWYAIGAEVTEGFDFENHIAEALVTPTAKKLLESDMMVQYHCSLHYNAS